MINFDYFMESIEFFYETYPILRHILKYPEHIADIIIQDNKNSIYINTYVARSVGKYYNEDPNEGLFKILKHNEIIKSKKQTYIPCPDLYKMYSTDNAFKGLIETRRFITKTQFDVIDNGNLYKKSFKYNGDYAGHITANQNNIVSDIHIEYKFRRSNLLNEMLRGCEGIANSKGEIEDEIIQTILKQINKK